MNATEQGGPKRIARVILKETWEPFREFTKAPKTLWGINLAYFFEGLAYFGVLTLLTKYLSENAGLGDIKAGLIVGFFTGGITFAAFFLGQVSDNWGIRRALLTALTLTFLGRFLLASGGSFFTAPGVIMFAFTYLGLLFVILGFGIIMPTVYAGVKKFTTPTTVAMGFAVAYGLNNLGAFMSGIISPPVRKTSARWLPPNGINGVFWILTLMTFISILITWRLLSRATAKKTERDAQINSVSPIQEKMPSPKIFSKRWLSEHPFRNGVFTFFIFIFIPVQTLYAHNWLTLPLYINRSYVPWVGNNFETFSNLNPLLIFVLTPLVAALTSHVSVYRMMFLGTLIMAASPFLLVLGPIPILLLIYILMLSIGEAMWQPRFLQFAAELAPEGRTGIYMGVAQFPYFICKLVTSFYSGWFLNRYCPATGPKNTSFMWLIYGSIALITPVAIILSRRWITSSMKGPIQGSQKHC